MLDLVYDEHVTEIIMPGSFFFLTCFMGIFLTNYWRNQGSILKGETLDWPIKSDGISLVDLFLV